MNREDWVYVGVRLYAIYLIVQALLSIGQMVVAAIVGQGPGAIFPLLLLLPGLGIGIALFVAAPVLASWSKGRVARSD